MSVFAYAFLLFVLIENLSLLLVQNLKVVHKDNSVTSLFEVGASIGWIFGKIFLICLFFRDDFMWYDPFIIWTSSFFIFLLIGAIYQKNIRNSEIEPIIRIFSFIGLGILISRGVIFLIG